ncbi:hypothetical protein CEP53_012323 [Fusarium sp. AF-6]|nr:hypothetical protein CEP53_012323 [Fusarium sp. AF-6]
MPWESHATTLVHAWFGGQETGHGLTDIIFGKQNPSGRLSITFPKSIKHTPAYLTFAKADYDIMYGEGVFIGHRYYEMLDQDPLFWFGYGLSYSTFTYKDLEVPKEIPVGKDGSMTISLTVTNNGPYDGAEVIQVYSLSFWSQEWSKWKAEAGEYVVVIASSSDPKDEIMRASFHLSETYLWEGL